METSVILEHPVPTVLLVLRGRQETQDRRVKRDYLATWEQRVPAGCQGQMESQALQVLKEIVEFKVFKVKLALQVLQEIQVHQDR